MNLNDKLVSRIVKSILKEQEEDKSVETLFNNNSIEVPAACKADTNKVPSVDINECVKETFAKVQGYIIVLKSLLVMEPGLKKQTFDLPIGESKKRRY